MSLFRKREPPASGPGAEQALPRAAACFTTPAMTRRAADWLGNLGGCRPLGILSDDYDDVVWQCTAERADLLLLELDFSNGVEDKDVSSRCDIAVEVRRKLPDCRVYLVCEDGHPEKLAALEKAVELKLIDGYCIGDLSAQQMRTWLDETAESMKTAASPQKIKNLEGGTKHETTDTQATDGVALNARHGAEPAPHHGAGGRQSRSNCRFC